MAEANSAPSTAIGDQRKLDPEQQKQGDKPGLHRQTQAVLDAH